MFEPDRLQTLRKLFERHAVEQQRLYDIQANQQSGIKRRLVAEDFADRAEPAVFRQREARGATAMLHMSAQNFLPPLLRNGTGRQQQHPGRTDFIERGLNIHFRMERTAGTQRDQGGLIRRAPVDDRHTSQQPLHDRRHQSRKRVSQRSLGIQGFYDD